MSSSDEGKDIVLFCFSQHVQGIISQVAAKLDEGNKVPVLFTWMPTDKRNEQAGKSFKQSFHQVIDFSHNLHQSTVNEVMSLEITNDEIDALEKRYAISLIDVIRGDRHCGKGFILGADHARAYIYQYSLDQMLRYVYWLAKKIIVELERLKPTLLIGALGPIQCTLLSYLAESFGIPVRYPLAARISYKFQWGINKYHWPYNFQEKYDSLKASQEFTARLAAAKKLPEKLKALARPVSVNVLTKKSLQSVSFRHLLVQLLQFVKKDLVNNLYPQRKQYANYSLVDNCKKAIQLRGQRKRYLKEAQSFTLPDCKYIFFPLTTEPEITLINQSQMCDNQISSIDMLSRSIPSTWKVVVKDHPLQGWPRSEILINTLASLPNVIVAPAFFSGESLLSNCTILASVKGTLANQAIMLGIPTLTFHPFFEGVVLPFVHYVSCVLSCKEAIQEIRNEGYLSRPKRIEFAKIYHEALKTKAVDFKNEDVIHFGRYTGTNIDEQCANEVLAMLYESLALENQMNKAITGT